MIVCNWNTLFQQSRLNFFLFFFFLTFFCYLNLFFFYFFEISAYRLYFFFFSCQLSLFTSSSDACPPKGWWSMVPLKSITPFIPPLAISPCDRENGWPTCLQRDASTTQRLDRLCSTGHHSEDQVWTQTARLHNKISKFKFNRTIKLIIWPHAPICILLCLS